MKHVVIFSGAGMSADSGLKTFRDSNGLWENYKIEDVATPRAWVENPKRVLDFYNQRRTQLLNAEPNEAHHSIASLENTHQVTVVTQNIDNLHERAGSSNVVHLHGELMKVRSEKFPKLVYTWNKAELKLGEKCEKGFQLRPHVVWFGEEVPMMDQAIDIVQSADVFIVIGTSLNVYPAASLIRHVPPHSNNFLIDPNPPTQEVENDFTIIKARANEGITLVREQLNA